MSEEIKPVAWRYRYIDGGIPDRKWLPCDEQEYHQRLGVAESPNICGTEAEPLYPASAITKLEEKIAGLEAKIDALMLEYCPLEMPAEQRTKWAKHQIANEATK